MIAMVNRWISIEDPVALRGLFFVQLAEYAQSPQVKEYEAGTRTFKVAFPGATKHAKKQFVQGCESEFLYAPISLIKARSLFECSLLDELKKRMNACSGLFKKNGILVQTFVKQGIVAVGQMNPLIGQLHSEQGVFMAVVHDGRVLVLGPAVGPLILSQPHAWHELHCRLGLDQRRPRLGGDDLAAPRSTQKHGLPKGQAITEDGGNLHTSLKGVVLNKACEHFPLADHITHQLTGSAVTTPFDPVSMCVMEMFDKATFAQVPLTLTGDPARPVAVREGAEDLYKVGVSPAWRIGRRPPATP